MKSAKFLPNDILRQNPLPTKKLLKLKTSNLEILKFEARASHSSGQILAGFLRLSFHNFFQMTRLVKAFYSKGLIPHGGLGEKVDNSTLKILNQSACLRFAS